MLILLTVIKWIVLIFGVLTLIDIAGILLIWGLRRICRTKAPSMNHRVHSRTTVDQLRPITVLKTTNNHD